MGGMLRQIVKRAIISSPFLQGQVSRLAGDFPRVFVFHRFSEAGVDYPHRVSGDVFRWQLQQISRRCQVMTFRECIEHYRVRGEWPERCAVITVDDGYRDFYQFGFPALRSLGLKATFFVTTNFVESQIWLWPDRLDFTLNNTEKKRLEIEMGGCHRVFPIEDNTTISSAWKALVNHCIGIPDQERKALLKEIEDKTEVALQDRPPEGYAAVTWEELNEMMESGIEIGSHTLNHPILSRLSSDALVDEIYESKNVLERQLGTPVYTFCYPNSGPGDINDQVIAAVADAGYIGAVFGTDLARWAPYEVPRMGVTNDRGDFLAKLCGLELAGTKLRNSFKAKNR